MATVSQINRDESQRRVASPLQQLRGFIRLYSFAEGIAVVLLYLTLWFWIGLVLDFGMFKAFGLDWVQILPRDIRIVILCAILAGLAAVVTLRLIVRLVREFREPALALVLERRFPDLLGDRLITAVELADPRIAERYGYSSAMIDETIREAAERVERLPIKDVFDWKRLRRYYTLVAILTLGLYVLTGVGLTAYHAVRGSHEGLSDFSGRFNEVAVIWFERNVLLHDAFWPRRAYLELLDFPGDEKRIGRDASSPAVRVRALKWVVADRDRVKAPEGWRALQWDEVAALLPGVNVPPVPANVRPSSWRGTVDEVESLLNKEDVRQNLEARDLLGVLDRLEDLAGKSSMSRTLRRLIVPGYVQVVFQGATTSGDQSLQKQGENEFSGTLSELKESIRFRVRGEDYYTPYKRIVLVPPPEVVELTRDEDQPAYLYYRVPRGLEARELLGKRQKLRNVPISLTGDTSRFELPAGTNVVLTARTDQDLHQPGGVRFKPRAGAVDVNAVVEQSDRRTFRVRFDNVTAPLDFVFEYINDDNVSGSRHVIIKPIEDTPPEVDVQIETVRKTSQGYLITPSALVPFSGKVRDDRGLDQVDYHYTVTKIEDKPNTSAQATFAASIIPFGSGGIDCNLASLALLSALHRPADDAEKTAEKAPLNSFAKAMKDREQNELSMPTILARLDSDVPTKTEVDRRLIREHVLDPELENFDVAKLALKQTDEKAIQPHYRVRIWVQAADSNIETGPHTGQSKEKFTLLVVSENELLAEIAKEEEGLHVKLEEAVTRLKDARLKMEKILQEMPEAKPEEFRALSQRTEEIGETLVKSGDSTREVLSDYRRILNELKCNRVSSGMINKVNEKICDPLDIAGREDFPRAEESAREFQKTLDAKNRDAKTGTAAMENLQRLIDRLSNVLDAMADVTTINNLITKLVEIEKSEAEEYKKLADLKSKIEEKILGDLLKKD